MNSKYFLSLYEGIQNPVRIQKEPVLSSSSSIVKPAKIELQAQSQIPVPNNPPVHPSSKGNSGSSVYQSKKSSNDPQEEKSIASQPIISSVEENKSDNGKVYNAIEELNRNCEDIKANLFLEAKEAFDQKDFRFNALFQAIVFSQNEHIHPLLEDKVPFLKYKGNFHYEFKAPLSSTDSTMPGQLLSNQKIKNSDKFEKLLTKFIDLESKYPQQLQAKTFLPKSYFEEIVKEKFQFIWSSDGFAPKGFSSLVKGYRRDLIRFHKKFHEDIIKKKVTRFKDLTFKHEILTYEKDLLKVLLRLGTNYKLSVKQDKSQQHRALSFLSSNTIQGKLWVMFDALSKLIRNDQTYHTPIDSATEVSYKMNFKLICMCLKNIIDSKTQ